MRRLFEVHATTVRAVVLAWCLSIISAYAPTALAQAPNRAAAPAPRGFAERPVDPRVQIRTYLLAETNEEIPYAVFASSKVRPGAKSPLVIALHGLCGSHTSLLRGNALDLAEEGGYILVGPMGYNPRAGMAFHRARGPCLRHRRRLARGPLPAARGRTRRICASSANKTSSTFSISFARNTTSTSAAST
jgi:hypothetical protein